MANENQRVRNNWRITAVANNIDTMRFSVMSYDGSYVPERGDEALFFEGGVRSFGGNIFKTNIRGVGGEGYIGLETDVTAQSFQAIPSKRYMTVTFTAGMNTRQILNAVATFLGNVLVASDQAVGPTINADLVYVNARVDELLNDVARLTGGQVWEIDYYRALSMYIPGTKIAPFSIVATNSYAIGDVEVEPIDSEYANHVIVVGDGVQGEYIDWAAVAANRNQIETRVYNADVGDTASATSLAFSITQTLLPRLKKVRYKTDQPGLRPGQAQTINLPRRKVNNTFLITEIVTEPVNETTARRTVTAIEGLVYKPGWREQVKAWGGISTTGTSIGSGGGIATQQPLRPIVPLGGEVGIGVRSPVANQWIFMSPVQQQIDTIPRRGSDAIVTATMRVNGAGSLQVRLFDVTEQKVVPGTSEVISSNFDPVTNQYEWVTRQFAVSLTPGSHFYQVQGQPSEADVDVQSITSLI